MESPYSIYVHIPFCQQRCHYCDFNTLAGQDDKIDVYIKALKQEIDVLTRNFAYQIPVHTIYFGGGTPSYIHEHQIADLMQMITERFNLQSDCEISIEANPGTLTRQKLDTYLVSGINRISLGVQAVDNDMLRYLGRIHNFEEAENNILLARACGFHNISADLIFGLPNMNLEQWQNSLKKIIALPLEHLSLYSLTIEEGTPFGKWFDEGKLHAPDEDLVADQYSYAIAWLEEHGFEQYEISNWRRKNNHIDYRSMHNCQYWLNQPYIGFGLGSHSCFNHQRIANTANLREYLSLVNIQTSGKSEEMPASVSVDSLSKSDEMKETMMLGLRLTKEGVSKEAFSSQYGENMEQIFASEIKELLHHHLVQWNGDRLILTQRGILLGNQVFMRFV